MADVVEVGVRKALDMGLGWAPVDAVASSLGQLGEDEEGVVPVRGFWVGVELEEQ